MQYSYWLYSPQDEEDDLDPSQNTEEQVSADALDPWEEGFMNGNNTAV
jgi:hypothetical protein